MFRGGIDICPHPSYRRFRNGQTSDPEISERERAEATATSPGRKLREMRLAIAVEDELGKEEILSRYLNIAYFGSGAYGIAAAAERYFGKPASALTLPEASLLAALVQSPDTDSPIDGDAEEALGRRSYVLGQMVRLGAVSEAEAARADAEPPEL